MTALVEEKCEACRAGAPSVTEAEVTELKPQIPEWEICTEDGVRKLARSFRFSNFVEALAFTNKVGDIAEQEGHHPRIVTEWGQAEVAWWTHAIHDLHRNDFIMAARTDALVDAQPVP